MPVSGSAEPIDPLDGPDPVQAWLRARSEGRLVALRTSGTMARPRRVLRTTDSWERSFAHVSELAGITTASRVWVPGPVDATMNLFARVHANCVGATLVEDPAQATHANLTPLSLDRAVRDQLLAAGVTAIVAGAALSRSSLARADAAGLTVHQYYGAAELSFVAWAHDGHALQAFPGADVRVVDEVIWVRSPYVCEGYDEPDSDGPLQWEGDFATVGDRGALTDGVLTVRGRGHDAVTVAGVTVVVADVESALHEHAEGTVVVLGLPDERLGEVLAAAVTDADDVERLRDAGRRLLQPAQRPSHWFVVPEIPRTDAEKPDRAGLRQMLATATPDQMAR
jgi:long-chain acyl-CoA synthetase